MRRQSAIPALLAFIGIGSMLVTAALLTRSESFSLGVAPSAPIAEIGPGATMCQGPIDAPADFDRVVLVLGTFMRPGQPLDVEVRAAPDGAPFATGRLAAGYGDNHEQVVRVGRVRGGRTISVCVTNRGRGRVAAYGGAELAHIPSRVTIDGTVKPVDATMRFLYDPPRSLLSLVPAMIDRATLFAPSWMSGWMLWVLFGVLACAAPGLVTLALARAHRAEETQRQ